MPNKYAPDWITTGYGREPNTGLWIEHGQSAAVTATPEPLLPELSLHDVPAKLNELERKLAEAGVTP